MGEWRGEIEMERSAWQRKTGELTETEGVWRQSGEPSKAGNSALDLFGHNQLHTKSSQYDGKAVECCKLPIFQPSPDYS